MFSFTWETLRSRLITFKKFLLYFIVASGVQLQKSKEREEQLEDVIQAYEKIHMEKTNLQRDLDKMVRLSTGTH